MDALIPLLLWESADDVLVEQVSFVGERLLIPYEPFLTESFLDKMPPETRVARAALGPTAMPTGTELERLGWFNPELNKECELASTFVNIPLTELAATWGLSKIKPQWPARVHRSRQGAWAYLELSHPLGSKKYIFQTNGYVWRWAIIPGQDGHRASHSTPSLTLLQQALGDRIQQGPDDQGIAASRVYTFMQPTLYIRQRVTFDLESFFQRNGRPIRLKWQVNENLPSTYWEYSWQPKITLAVKPSLEETEMGLQLRLVLETRKGGFGIFGGGKIQIFPAEPISLKQFFLLRGRGGLDGFFHPILEQLLKMQQ